ncbi:MAG: hypothetical protein E7053_10880 [Lentisphaerae bacterium]|nr:hypothetical protein [Lentisphaerota bacterium]
MKKIFLYLTILLISGCASTTETITVSTGTTPPPVYQQGSQVVQAIIAANYQEFAAGANENGTDAMSADNFMASCKQLEELYGKAQSFRFLGELQTPLLVNQLYAISFKRLGANGETIEHEQLLQLIFGQEDGKYKLLGMRFM